MTEVSFHFNAPDRLGYACRLLRKGYLRGARMVVLVEPHQLSALDAQLWQKTTHDFLPHSTDADPPHVQAHSPVQLWSTEPLLTPASSGHVLVNLRQTLPAGYAAFAKVIEVVTSDPQDRHQARERWRQYRLAGIEPQRHDLQLAPQG